MANFQYNNPVKIVFGEGRIHDVSQIIGNRKALLLTSPGFTARGVVARLLKACPKISGVLDNVQPNPTFSMLSTQYEKIQANHFDVIIALGGGSVMDSAKVLAVRHDTPSFSRVEHLIRNKDHSNHNYRVIPMIAIPTTAGSGSELTPWATVWDDLEKRKYSLHLHDTWFECCICDPQITYSLPRDVTIQSGLDALSHALESIWNVNASPITLGFAIAAIQGVVKNLPVLVHKPDFTECRNEMMLASLNAALAFSNTQTSIAHAMSYYMTLNKGIVHGIATSFTLPTIAKAVADKHRFVDEALHRALGARPASTLRELLHRLGVSDQPVDYGLIDRDWQAIRNSLRETNRMQNSLVSFDDFYEALNL